LSREAANTAYRPANTAYRPADVIPEIRQRVSTLDPDAMMQFTVFN
jgi:hypothetical protein